MRYKRFSRVVWTFSIPKFWQFSTERECVNYRGRSESVAPFAVGGHGIFLEKYPLGARARSFLSEIFTSSGRKSFFEMVVQLNPLCAAHEPERPGTPSRAGRVGSWTKIISKSATDPAKN